MVDATGQLEQLVARHVLPSGAAMQVAGVEELQRMAKLRCCRKPAVSRSARRTRAAEIFMRGTCSSAGVVRDLEYSSALVQGSAELLTSTLAAALDNAGLPAPHKQAAPTSPRLACSEQLIPRWVR